MSFELQSHQWPARRAILLVHGIGNAKEGDYSQLVTGIESVLGDAAAETVIYQLWYDQVNDWFAAKTDLAHLITVAVQTLARKIDDAEIGEAIAESAGDVLWPVLSANARAAAREAFLAQTKQMVQDGVASGVPVRRQKLSIICHSLGCFHTYEALHHAALFPTHVLQPATHEVVFENVVFMASPVQLIRTVAGAMGNLVPNKRWLYSVREEGLAIPSETTLSGTVVPSVRNWVSITGDLDPVGGHFFKKKEKWAYMDVAGQTSRIDKQDALNITTRQQLVQVLRASLRERQPPEITASNPHSWENYVQQHADELRQWMTA